MATSGGTPRVFTVGHSTHPIERFIDLLTGFGIEILCDVRSYPGSRRYPQFMREALAASLQAAGIEYQWIRALGGRRSSKKTTSLHTAWKVTAFRAYADYADTPEFEAGLAELIGHASRQPTAFMCAEGLWWQCHRRIIADHLLVRGWQVQDILPNGEVIGHELPPFAAVRKGRLIYAGAAEEKSQ